MSLLNTVHREKDGKKEPTRYYSKKQEDAVAKKFSGARVKNSGATKLAPGDVLTDQFLLECKTRMSDSESIIIHKSWLDKIKKEALFAGKPYQALLFNFGPNQPNYAIIEETLFQELIDFLNKNCM